MIAPLNYFLINKIGIVGAGISSLVAYTVYNLIRLIFLWKKFKMQPFTVKTLRSVLMAPALYCITYFILQQVHGWTGIFCKGILFSSMFIAAALYLNLTPDAIPVLKTLKKKLGLQRA
jgi:O-antigen/teichoic acid export membrane protein